VRYLTPVRGPILQEIHFAIELHNRDLILLTQRLNQVFGNLSYRPNVLCGINIATGIEQQQDAGRNAPQAASFLAHAILENEKVVQFNRRIEVAETIVSCDRNLNFFDVDLDRFLLIFSLFFCSDSD